LEIEFNWRKLLFFVFIALILGGALLLLPRYLSDKLNTHSAAINNQNAHSVAIKVDNQSAWRIEGVNDCLPKLSAWMGEKSPVENLTVIVTDTVSADMAVAVQQSGHAGNPDAEVTGKCEKTEADNVLCTIAVKRGSTSPNLDVAATVEIAWLVQEFYRPKTKAAWEKAQLQNGLDVFQPLIHQEDEQWISDCLHIAR